MMMSCGWTASVTNQMTGLHELAEGAARFIWERLFQPPNAEVRDPAGTKANVTAICNDYIVAVSYDYGAFGIYADRVEDYE
jgi:hypothetical protein